MKHKNAYRKGRKVFVVDGSRTPFLKVRGKPGPFRAADLAVAAGQALLKRQKFLPTQFDEVILGCAIPLPEEANIARIVALRLGCGNNVPGWTVHRNCGSGLQAIDNAAHNIATGRANLVLAGGADAMSRAPVLLNEHMVDWLAGWRQSKGIVAKVKQLALLRPNMFAPELALLRGLRDPVVGLSMGQTAEKLAYQFGITRTQMDEFAVRSHQRLAEAQKNNVLSEVNPIFAADGTYFEYDDGVRPDTDVAKLAKLKPVFDRNYGTVTAGNSSQITDGAGLLILASEEAVKAHSLPVLGQIIDIEWAALDPTVMGLGPVFASIPLMQRHRLTLDDIDYWEINEAFAAQVIAVNRAFDDADFCKAYFGLKNKVGAIDSVRLNIHGGAVAIGHPIAASGARLVLQLLNIMKRKQAKRGIAALCIGGGQGGAMLFEAVDPDDRHISGEEQ